MDNETQIGYSLQQEPKPTTKRIDSLRIQYATNRLIDSVWTLAYVLKSNDTLHILSHDRTNPIGYEREYQLPSFSLGERAGDSRVVESVTITGRGIGYTETVYKVENQEGVFSYKG